MDFEDFVPGPKISWSGEPPPRDIRVLIRRLAEDVWLKHPGLRKIVIEFPEHTKQNARARDIMENRA